MRRFVPAVVAGTVVLSLFDPWAFLGHLVAVSLAAWLLALLGPRSVAERVGAVVGAAWLGWAALRGGLTGLCGYTAAWALAASAMAAVLHPRSE